MIWAQSSTTPLRGVGQGTHSVLTLTSCRHLGVIQNRPKDCAISSLHNPAAHTCSNGTQGSNPCRREGPSSGQALSPPALLHCVAAAPSAVPHSRQGARRGQGSPGHPRTAGTAVCVLL